MAAERRVEMWRGCSRVGYVAVAQHEAFDTEFSWQLSKLRSLASEVMPDAAHCGYFKDFIVRGDPTMQSSDFARVVPT